MVTFFLLLAKLCSEFSVNSIDGDNTCTRFFTLLSDKVMKDRDEYHCNHEGGR